MKSSNKKKNDQLKMNHGTASNRLKKSILLDLLCKLDYNLCYRCGEEIKIAENLSIDHIKPWLDSENPIELFFDLNNVTFSHRRCNSGAARKPHKLDLTKDERIEYYRKKSKERNRKSYSKEKRRERFLRTGN